MLDDIRFSPWSIAVEDWKPEHEVYYQSVFFQGNGDLGLRAVLPGDALQPHAHGMFKAGVYEYIKPGITDLVNLPDPCRLDIVIDGLKYTESAKNIRQRLDMSNGLLTRTWRFNGTEFVLERFCSFDDKRLISMRLTCTAHERRTLVIRQSFDASVVNLPVNDDQTVVNNEYVPLLKDVRAETGKTTMTLGVRTMQDSFSFRYMGTTKSNGEYLSEFGNNVDSVFSQYQITLEPESSVVLEYFLLIQEEGTDVPASVEQLERYRDIGFAGLLDRSRQRLQELWSLADIEIDGPEADQCAVRYAIFGLIQNCSTTKPVSIGARGLTHGRYKGCYFWDTEVFMLPFFLYCYPQAAKHLLQYRIEQLPAAMENARKHNAQGARYPWMCSLDGSEQCESWDIGKCEIHVTADIAWALHQYALVTGDTDWERRCAAPVYLETARFWTSRFSYQKASGQWEMLFVKGPDEYAGVTKNNTFTTVMALYNLSLALYAVDHGWIVADVDEVEQWREILHHAKIPYSETYGTYLEDDTFELLEDVELATLKHNDEPLYHTICFDRLQRYKLLKQPDILLLYLLIPQAFSAEQAVNAWKLYEPITAHDSTLSWGMHSAAGYRLGFVEQAENYLRKSLFLDLRDLMGNTAKEGLHVGGFGATWQALVFGCLRLTVGDEHTVEVSPQLPTQWKSMKTRISVAGKLYEIRVNHGTAEIVEHEAMSTAELEDGTSGWNEGKETKAGRFLLTDRKSGI